MTDPYSSKPWLKFYDPHALSAINYPSMSYAESMDQTFRKFPQTVALHYMGNGITYGELDVLTNQLARFLIKEGCKAGDTVGVHLPNVPAVYIAALAIQKAGCVYTGVSALLTPDELEYQLNDSGAKALVTLDLLFGAVQKAVPNTRVKTVIVASVGDYLPTIKKALGTLLKKIPKGDWGAIPGVKVISFLDALRGMPTDRTLVKVKPENACLMMYTGGTTGPPKGAVLTHNNVVRHTAQLGKWMNVDSMAGMVGVSAFPMFHQAGNFLSLWSMNMGATQVVVPDPRNLDFIISAIKKYKPTGIINVPTIFLELMKKPAFRSIDFSTVEWFVSGASPFPAENIREFEDIVGKGKLMEVYGMTETTPLITATPRFGKRKVGSVGLPIVDTDVKLVDPDTGQSVPTGSPGELACRGHQVMRGYHNKPDETAHTIRDGWMHTGDIAEMDEEGYFYIVDRLKDMLSVSGFKVFTRQVDDVLIEHPDVEIAATIGLPDPNRPGSEIVACAIVLKPGGEKSDAMRGRIIAYMKEKVAPYKVPKVIQFMDQLPMSAVGKVLKRELRKVMTG
jgi:acyl-CoA synthetase (AMP-forming)/AMP-acid ligase II